MSKESPKKQIVSTRAVELKFGYEDKETPEVKHRRVVFGKRPTGGDFMRSADNSAGSDIQFALELTQSAITEFGKLEMPVPLTVLLSLNQIDREKLMNEYFSFLDASAADEGKVIENGKVELAFGIERGELKIKNVEFGKLLNGYDEIEIERETKTEWQANGLRLSRQITVPESVTLAEIEALDINDFTLLRNAEEQWLNSFR